jgi:hypothetical protein
MITAERECIYWKTERYISPDGVSYTRSFTVTASQPTQFLTLFTFPHGRGKTKVVKCLLL